MRVFVTGVGGQLGHDVMNELAKRGHEGIGSDILPALDNGFAYYPLDITDAAAVEATLQQVKPDAVIHCAAWTAVDLRPGSETYGKWYGVELTEENKKQFYISEGFAHGFLVLSDTAEFCYKVTDFYHPGDEGGLAWNDPAIGIDWPELVGEYHGTASAEGYTLQDGTPLNLSEKDQKWLGL